jgi:hypothetical protein
MSKIREAVALAVDERIYVLIEAELEKIDEFRVDSVKNRAEYFAKRQRDLRQWRETAINEVTADLERRMLN